MKPHVAGALLSMLAFVLSGCATTVVATLSSDAHSGFSGGAGRRIVVVSPFDDERPIIGVCGEQTGNFGSGPPILCDKDPAPFITSALVEELRRVGFEVETVAAPRAPIDAPVLRGALVQLYAQPTGGFSHFVIEADVHVRLEVRSPSGAVARRSFFVKGNQGVGGTVGAAVQQSITDATNRVVVAMTGALLSLGNEHPDLAGAREGTNP